MGKDSLLRTGIFDAVTLCNKDMFNEEVEISQEARAWYSAAKKNHLTKYSHSPLVARYRNARRSAGGRYVETKTPSDVLAERCELVAMLISSGGYQDDRGFAPAFNSDVILSGLAIAANNAQPFLWTEKVMLIATEMKLPDHVFGGEGWPYPLMWWTYQKKIRTVNSLMDRQVVLQASVLIKRSDGVAIWSLLDSRENPDEPEFELEIGQDFLRFGDRMKPALPGFLDGPTEIMKMVSFLNSKYIDHSSQRMCRDDRKLLIHADMPEEAEQTVHVVDLRVKEQVRKETDEDGAERDWAGRWWVRGHIRAQWCSGSKTHKLIYIAPHIKGPEDKPMIEKVYRVIR